MMNFIRKSFPPWRCRRKSSSVKSLPKNASGKNHSAASCMRKSGVRKSGIPRPWRMNRGGLQAAHCCPKTADASRCRIDSIDMQCQKRSIITVRLPVSALGGGEAGSPGKRRRVKKIGTVTIGHDTRWIMASGLSLVRAYHNGPIVDCPDFFTRTEAQPGLWRINHQAPEGARLLCRPPGLIRLPT